MRLEPGEARVVGSLVEKQLTTPDQYPLTLNALVAACNQSSNRDPVVNYSQHEVESTLATLKEKGLVRWVYPSHGRSVTRYRQVLDEMSGMDERQLALIGVLLLRGPQTLGELRARTERMANFASIDELEHELEVLGRGDEPFVARLPQRPGQREARYVQRLAESPRPLEPVQTPEEPAARSQSSPSSSVGERLTALEHEVAALRHDLEELMTRPTP